MTLDEIFNQLLDARLDIRFVETFGPKYKKFRESFNDLITANNQHLQKIDKLEKTITSLSGSIDTINKNNADYGQIIRNLNLKLQKHTQEIEDLRSQLEECHNHVASVDTRNNELWQMIEKLKTELRHLSDGISTANDTNRELEKKIIDLESKNKSLPSRNNEYGSKGTYGKSERPNGETVNGSYNLYSGQPEKAPYNAQADSIITKFNSWAANPVGPIPSWFTFLAGEPRIRTHQQIVETAEETKWITNRTGGKRYLFPNPNSFNQMTDIRELYDMDQSKLKEKGRNKIQITAACEISASGWIEFPGTLKILP